MKRKIAFVIFGFILITCLMFYLPSSLANSAVAPSLEAIQQDFLHWKQVNSDGFGSPSNASILALEVFNNELYAASDNYLSGARVWRLEPNGWWNAVSQPGFGAEYGNLNPAIADMIVFNGSLYAGSGWSGGGYHTQIWRSATGTMWNQVVADGFGNQYNLLASPFGIFDGKLYVGVQNIHDGLEIWRTATGNSGEWEIVVSGGNGNTNDYIVTSFIQFGNNLFAAVENSAQGAEIWQSSNGTTWTTASTGGFGDTRNIQTGGISIFGGNLYVGTRNNVTGGQLFRSSNGVNWVPVIEDGFDDVNNYKIEMVFVWNGNLFAGTDNNLTGTEIWQSADGLNWNQVNQDGFSDLNTRAVLWNSAVALYNHFMYIGAENLITGGEVWKNLGYPQFIPSITR